ncbi:hypothetical protein [Pseudoalteromonas aliena]|uniref:hypothetical protein n=1 Tax=Pseudoalteromonas aliena TaxID=247523 RepID=UPI002493EC56|nr:hypothetical protein [Pseudoalteromonas aliena]
MRQNNHKKLKEEIGSGHGRIESRYYRQLRMSEWIEEGNAWQGVQTLIEVTRKRIIKDKEQQ